MAVTTNYTTLQANVASWLARSDLNSDIPTFIQNWESDFYRDPENHAAWMESALSVTLSNNVAAVPTDYLALRVAYFSGQPPLEKVSLDQLYKRYPRGTSSMYGGSSRFIARNGANFEFGPGVASGTLLGTYYAKPTAIRAASSDAASHFLITDCPDLCLYGSLLQAMPYIKDDMRIPIWKGAYDLAVDSYRRRFTADKYSGSTPFTVAV
jgi:hypothetical protein